MTTRPYRYLPPPQAMKSGFAYDGHFLSVERGMLFDSAPLIEGTTEDLTFFTNFLGKTSAQISPQVTPVMDASKKVIGGCLSKPRCFEVHRLRVRAFPAEPGPGVAAAWDRIRVSCALRLHIGVRDAFDGPIALLPFTFTPRPWLILPDQLFVVHLQPERGQIWRNWHVIVSLDGYMGWETP